MASNTGAPTAAADRLKHFFFALMALAVLLVLWTDERFWLNPADPHWKHIAPVKWLLMIHGLAGATALVSGATQFSTRIRRSMPATHRLIGKIYISAVSVAAPVALWIGTGPLEPVTIHVEQCFQAGLWWLSAMIAWACIRNGQIALHKPWMMRSYGFTLIFVLARVPDAFMSTEDPQFLSDLLWSLVIVAVIAPDIILTTQTLWRIRSAKARHARAAALQQGGLAPAE
ncbi:MAG: DUF2306 domain-containing protein [Sphingomonas sp.]